MDSSSGSTPPTARSKSGRSYSLSSVDTLDALVEDLAFREDELTDSKAVQGGASRILASIIRLRALLADSHSLYLKDQFRSLGGFERLCQYLKCVSELDCKVDTSSRRVVVEAFHSVFTALSESFKDHDVNRDYFAGRTNGWQRLQDSASRLVFPQDESGGFNDLERNAPQMLDLLFALMLGEDAFRMSTFINVPQNIDRDARYFQTAGNSGQRDAYNTEYYSDIEANSGITTAHNDLVLNYEVTPIIFRIWTCLPRQDGLTVSSVRIASASVLLCLLRIIKGSFHNAKLISKSGLMEALAQRLLNNQDGAYEHACLKLLFSEMALFGCTSLCQAGQLFKHANNSDQGVELLRIMVHASQQPPCFHFDMSLTGFASLELRELKGTFPPQRPSFGYTFIAWLKMNRLDSTAHTTIFGAFDETQNCFLLLYLERDTQQLVLQTSVKSSRPSVRFKTTKFLPKSWYHVAIVHKQPQGDESSHADLFLNGQLCDRVKCQYPKTPPSLKDTGMNRSSKAKVQAFFGTPHDLSPRLGRGMVQSAMCISNAYLFSETLSDELIFVYKSLGPRYCGNFQDGLGSFQTYQASASLNLRNEMLHSGDEASSSIAAAIKARVSNLIGEEKLLLGLCATTELGSMSQLKLSRPRSMSYRWSSRKHSITSSSNGFTVNTAIPQMPAALLKPSGTFSSTGGVTLYKPECMDDVSWRLSGCVPVCLGLVEESNSARRLEENVALVFALVKDNWRNSEAFEKQNGYAILAWLLTRKFRSLFNDDYHNQRNEKYSSRQYINGPTPLRIFQAILDFVGYDSESPKRSVIINPLAYRALIVDCDIWQLCDVMTQQLYFAQFIVFAQDSRNSSFNSKRLSRMRKFWHSVSVPHKYIEPFIVSKRSCFALEWSCSRSKTAPFFGASSHPSRGYYKSRQIFAEPA